MPLLWKWERKKGVKLGFCASLLNLRFLALMVGLHVYSYHFRNVLCQNHLKKSESESVYFLNCSSFVASWAAVVWQFIMIAGGNHGNGAAFVFSSKKLKISISTKRQLNSEVSEHGVWNFLKHFWIFLFYKKRMFVSSSCKEQNVFFLSFKLFSFEYLHVHCTLYMYL